MICYSPNDMGGGEGGGGLWLVMSHFAILYNHSVTYIQSQKYHSAYCISASRLMTRLCVNRKNKIQCLLKIDLKDREYLLFSVFKQLFIHVLHSKIFYPSFLIENMTRWGTCMHWWRLAELSCICIYDETAILIYSRSELCNQICMI